MIQSITGKLITLKTKPCIRFLKEFTCFDFASHASHWFPNPIGSTTGARVSLSQMSHANATVHSTRRNQG
jgi:hypothetical protein